MEKKPFNNKSLNLEIHQPSTTVKAAEQKNIQQSKLWLECPIIQNYQ